MKLSEESRIGEVGFPASPMLSSKNAIFHIFKWIAIASIVIMFLSLMTGVIIRYVLSTNLGWISEVPNLFFPWLAMSAIVAAAAKNEHIGVELIVSKLPRVADKVVTLGINIIALIAFAVIAVSGLEVIKITGSQLLPVTQISIAWAYWSVVIGFIALAIISFINIVLVLVGYELGESQVSHGEDGV